jgi:isoquinoline 1-oxidoreductase alpha subunit
MKLRINQREYEIEDGDVSRPLLWVLRDELGLTGTKYGCGKGICGSCTVHLDGQAARSCVVPLSLVEGKDITTIEGLAEKFSPDQDLLHPVQQAFVDHQVPQCGWCMPGQMMTAAAFLEMNPQPTEEEITNAMGNNYCRCGTYVRIKEAVVDAAHNMEMRETNG